MKIENNESWVLKKLKSYNNERKAVFCTGNMKLLFEKMRQYRSEFFKAIIDFKNKRGSIFFLTSNVNQAWEG